MPFRFLRMGCGVSKIDANGVAIPNKSIIPNFSTRWKHTTKCIPPKKETLLMPENDDRPSISISKYDDNNLYCVIPKGAREVNNEKRIAKIKTMVEEAEKNDERGRLHEDEGKETEDQDDNNDDDERAISKVRVGEENVNNDFPSSPSFKVYFTDKDVETKKKDDDYNKVGLKDVTPVSATISPTKESESLVMEKGEEKKEIRKRSTFKNVLPKNLLNARSSSNSPTRSTQQYHHKVAS